MGDEMIKAEDHLKTMFVPSGGYNKRIIAWLQEGSAGIEVTQEEALLLIDLDWYYRDEDEPIAIADE